MLILARKEDETIEMVVPPSTTETRIVMQIVRIKGNTVRVGVAAPRTTAIKRGELVDLPAPAPQSPQPNDNDA